MDPAESRTAVETLLEVVDLLSSGAEVTEEDLKGIDAICEEIREKLKVEPAGKPESFPRGHWVFQVERTQYATFSVPAADFERASDAAAAYLHDNIEALRFTWDRRDPLSLSVLKLKREPGESHE